MRFPVAMFAVVTALAVAASGCGGGSNSGGGQASKQVNPNATESSPPGDIPDNQAFVAYKPPGGGYTVKVPEGWARTQKGRATTFTDKLNSVTMETVAVAPKPPSGARVSTVTRQAGRARRALYGITGKPDPVTGKSRKLAVERYVFAHGGRHVVLTLQGAKGADNVDPWRIVSNSLRYTR